MIFPEEEPAWCGKLYTEEVIHGCTKNLSQNVVIKATNIGHLISVGQEFRGDSWKLLIQGLSCGCSPAVSRDFSHVNV